MSKLPLLQWNAVKQSKPRIWTRYNSLLVPTEVLVQFGNMFLFSRDMNIVLFDHDIEFNPNQNLSLPYFTDEKQAYLHVFNRGSFARYHRETSFTKYLIKADILSVLVTDLTIAIVENFFSKNVHCTVHQNVDNVDL